MADAVRRDSAYYKSPEYKRECRRRKAERDGREFRPSGPGGKGRAAGYAKPQLSAPAKEARRAWREWIEVRAPGWWLKRYANVRRAVTLKRARAYAKARYDADPEANQRKVRLYKDSNPDRVGQWHRTRQERLAEHGVEPLSNADIAGIFRRANCPYCQCELDERSEIDHVIPLARGGRHELRNLVACCPDCNRAKAARPFSEWLTMIAPANRGAAERMFVRRFGPVEAGERLAAEG